MPVNNFIACDKVGKWAESEREIKILTVKKSIKGPTIAYTLIEDFSFYGKNTTRNMTAGYTDHEKNSIKSIPV